MSSKTCTFFGHRDTPESVRSLLYETLVRLIKFQGVDTFYVGNQGKFDIIVRQELKEMTKIFPHIKYYVMLAYIPGKRNEYDTTDYSDTVYPDGLEYSPQKYAVDKRNLIMLNRSDIVVTYVCRPFGGAAKFKELAQKKGKEVIELHRY